MARFMPKCDLVVAKGIPGDTQELVVTESSFFIIALQLQKSHRLFDSANRISKAHTSWLFRKWIYYER